MIPALTNLEPKPVWKHFDRLAAIPRASTKEAAARDYVLSVAGKLGLESVQDDVGNLVVRKPARPGREGAPMALLQGHLDMVCEKNEGTVHNFDTDPIKVVKDGDWLKADGTTLGSDNGVGVAAALAVMESNDIAHGPLEFVFTIDEETGLTGAAAFPGGLLKSKYFLNLDNEEKGTICIGCSGGIKTIARRKIVLRPANAESAWRIKVSGLKGGHSGVDIHLGRGNAIRIMGGVLQVLLERLPIEIAEINGGKRSERDSARSCGCGAGRPLAREGNEVACGQQRKPDTNPTWEASIPDCRSRSRRANAREKCWMRMTRNRRWRCWRRCTMAFWQ
jgi:dipeptidase D